MSQQILTRAQLLAQCTKALDELLEFAGGPTHLARMLDVDANICSAWKFRGKISKEGAKLVESHPTLGENFSVSRLRPDLRIAAHGRQA